MVNHNLEIYYQRWETLDGLITSTIASYDSKLNGRKKFSREDTILHLLRNLQEFARGQFLLFYNGFDRDNPLRSETDPKLELSSEFPPEDILWGILDQISHDLDLIIRAASQRI